MPSWPHFASVALICCSFCSFSLCGCYLSDVQAPALGAFRSLTQREALPQPRCAIRGNICLGRRINELLLAPRGAGSDGPLTTYPARGKGKGGELWFRFEPNKDGRQNQVHVSPEWCDLVRYCVKIILFYSDEVRHLALREEQHLFILISEWNLTYGSHCSLSSATEQNVDYEYRHLNIHNRKRRSQKTQQTARPMSYEVFFFWLVGGSGGNQSHHYPSIFRQWNITEDGLANGNIYYMRTQQARHTRQSALAQDPTISPLTRQRDLNYTSRDMQMIYQHHLRLAVCRRETGTPRLSWYTGKHE